MKWVLFEVSVKNKQSETKQNVFNLESPIYKSRENRGKKLL